MNVKKILVTIVGIILLILIATSAQATSSLKANLICSTNELKKLEEVIVTIQFEQYQEIQKGINAYKATLRYDKEIFEEVLQDNFECQNNWEKLKYNKQTGEFVAIKKTGSIVQEEVVKIKLKVKENINKNYTEITIKEIVASEGIEDIIIDEQKIELKVQDGMQKPDDNNEPNLPINPDNENKPTNPPNSNDNGTTTPIPKTGGNEIVLVLVVSLAETLLLIAYNRKKKAKTIQNQIEGIQIQNKGVTIAKKILISITIVSLISIQIVAVIYATISNLVNKGELNGDGKVDYSDAELLELHLIHMQALPDNKLENADINNDEQITVTDLSLLIQKLEKAINYNFTIQGDIKTYKDDKQTKYFEKNEQITLKFDSTNATSYYPIKVIINGKDYSLTKNGITYETIIKGFENSGEKNITIEKIILNNEKELEVTKNNKTSIEVLKNKPTINSFNYEKTQDNKIKAKFTIIDEENTITQGTVIIVDEEQKEIKKQKVKKGENEIIFLKNQSEIYNLKVVATYDLDTNVLSNNENKYENQILLEKPINVSIRMLEMKDIKNIALYKKTGNNVEVLSSVNIADLDNLENYLVKVEMKDAPSFYSQIKEYKQEEVLKFILDYDDVIQYTNDQKHNWIEVEFGKIENGIATRSEINTLIKQMNENPGGEYTLTTDLDASDITSGTAIITTEFSGKLNGNGHKIINLSRPLFEYLNGATIENIILENANMRAYGVLTPNMSSTIVKNVHLINPYVASPGINGTGALVRKCKCNVINRELFSN